MTEHLTLTGKLDLAAVGPLHTDLLARDGHDITLNLGAVSHLGTLCLQTLIAAAKSAREAGHTFHITDTNDRILQQLAAMGLTLETITEGSK